jgi:hypothetical protein
MKETIKPPQNKWKHKKQDIRSLPQATNPLSTTQIIPHILPRGIPVVVFKIEGHGYEFKGARGERYEVETAMTRQSFVQFLPNISRRNKIETYT